MSELSHYFRRFPAVASRPCLFGCALLAALLSIIPARVFPQQAAPEQAQKDQPQQAGMSTGVARAPVKDAKNRPITAGGFVDGAPVIFADATHSSGLDKFHHIMGAPEKNVILE